MSPTILICNSQAGPLTGGPRSVLMLMSSLRAAGWTPVFASAGATELGAKARQLGIEACVVGPRRPRARAARYYLHPKYRAERIAEMRALTDLCRERSVAVLWARSLFVFWNVSAVAARARLPAVWDVGFEPTATRAFRAVNLAALRRASAVVTQGRNIAEQLFGPTVLRRSGKVHAILPPVMGDRMERLEHAAAQRRPSTGGPMLLSIASLHPRKNQALLLRATAELLGRHPTVKVRLVGHEGRRGYAGHLRHLAESLGIWENVEFLGWRDDVPELMADAYALVVSSRKEGLPHVVREAMVAGLPIVASDVGVVPEVVQHRQTGWLFRSGSKEGLVTSLHECLSDPARADRVARQARMAAQELFSHGRWAGRYDQVLRSLIDGGNLSAQRRAF